MTHLIGGFHQRHLCLRGTTVALFDYARAWENSCDGVSIIFTKSSHPEHNSEVIKKFQARFTVVFYDNFSEVDDWVKRLLIDFLYTIKAGFNDGDISSIVPTIVHAVFDCYQPHGLYTFVSSEIAKKYNGTWLPHLISELPYQDGDKLRELLKIPSEAFVYGRYGGKDTFSIPFVKELIIEEIDKHPEFFFLFVNTDKFIDHPRCIFLDCIVSLSEKGKFIDACDAMLHARADGETFGLSVGEFARSGKQVLTCPSHQDNEHIKHLKEQASVYNSKDELRAMLWTEEKKIFRPPVAYTDSEEKKVMEIFREVLSKWEQGKNQPSRPIK